jgi:hypothetical protein
LDGELLQALDEAADFVVISEEVEKQQFVPAGFEDEPCRQA